MSQTIPDFVYHLVEQANWESVKQHGLLPASQLIKRAQEPASLHRTHRARHTILRDATHIRDQGPIPPQALATCLIGLSPADWYAHLNSHVFFWLDMDRLERQRLACAPRPQRILKIATAPLLQAHADIAYLTPINTGFARRKPAKRGLASFVSYHEWQKHGWASEANALGTTPRANSHKPVELALRGAIPDLWIFAEEI